MVNAGQSALVTAIAGQTMLVDLGTIVGGTCQVARSVSFATARSFIPMSERPALEQAFAFGLTAPASGSGPPVPTSERFMLVVGHTDQVGGADPNNRLSARRAATTLAVFTVDVAAWEESYQRDPWNEIELGQMAAVVDPAGGSGSLQRYIGDSNARATLFEQYLIALRPDWLTAHQSVRPELVTTPNPARLGCGFQHPVVNAPGQSRAENRRAEFFFFNTATARFTNCGGYPARQVTCGRFITIQIDLTDECGLPYSGPFNLTLPVGGVLRDQRTDAQGHYSRENAPQGRFTVEVEGWSASRRATSASPTVRLQLQRPITRAGTALRRGGQNFRFFGTNAYYLLESSAHAAQGSSPHQTQIGEFFRIMHDCGIRVVRTWGFNEDQSKPAITRTLSGGPLATPAPGAGLSALAEVVNEAERQGIYLIIALSNYNPDYGGMCQYARWAANYETTEPNHFPDHFVEELFYTGTVTSDPALGRQVAADPRDIYLDHACRVINRFRGRPHILAWELMNEPGVKAFNAPSRLNALELEMRNWIGTMAARIRQRCNPAPQLLSIGGPHITKLNFIFDSPDVRNNIDLMDTHLYPVNFQMGVTPARDALIDAVTEANTRNVPFYLGEFGIQRDISRSRPPEYEDWSMLLLGGGADGMLFWQLLPPSRPMFDPFEINVDLVAAPASGVGPLRSVPPSATGGNHAAPPSDAVAVVDFVNRHLSTPGPNRWRVCP